MSKKKKLTKEEVFERIEQAALQHMVNAVEDYCMNDDDADELLGEVFLPFLKDLIKKEIEPRLKAMAKDKKLLDKIAKDILTKKLSVL